MAQFHISEKLQLEYLLFNKTSLSGKIIPGYTITFGLTKPLYIELAIIVVVIQAHERGCVA